MKSSKAKPILKAQQQKTTTQSRASTRSSLNYYARDKSLDKEKTNDLKAELENKQSQNQKQDTADQINHHPSQTQPDNPSSQSQIEAFTQDQDSLTPDEATDWLEQHFQNEGGTTVKLTLSPGTDLGADDLKQWTRDVLSELLELRRDRKAVQEMNRRRDTTRNEGTVVTVEGLFKRSSSDFDEGLSNEAQTEMCFKGVSGSVPESLPTKALFKTANDFFNVLPEGVSGNDLLIAEV